MSDPQRHVVPADIAEQMFPQHHPDSYHPAYDFSPPSITWLVGPIDCETCDGSGNVQVYGRNSPPCPDCNGLGYPPTVEIVSEHPIGGYPPHLGVVTDVRPHGVVKLGTPVPISGCSWSKEHICTHGNLVIYHAALEHPYSQQACAERIITDNIGPCSPGQVAYPIEVTS